MRRDGRGWKGQGGGKERRGEEREDGGRGEKREKEERSMGEGIMREKERERESVFYREEVNGTRRTRQETEKYR